jgi:signal peptidase I
VTRGWLLTTLAVLGVALALPRATFLVSLWLKGWQLVTVQSGSMAPTYPIGSLFVVEPIDASEARVGMAVVFEDPQIPGRVLTHRVVARVSANSLQFWTQGDGNAHRDVFPVPARLIRGRVRWKVTHLGGPMMWLRWPRAFILLVLSRLSVRYR